MCSAFLLTAPLHSFIFFSLPLSSSLFLLCLMTYRNDTAKSNSMTLHKSYLYSMRNVLSGLFTAALLLVICSTSNAQNRTGFGQTAQYAQSCPKIDGVAAQPGCVAVAMAHVMSRHCYPEKPTGSVAYVTSTHKLFVSAELDQCSFDWNRINNMVSDADTAAVAQLLFMCGAAAYTDYKVQNSTASVANQMAALVENFGFDADMRLHSREFYTDEEWHALLQKEIGEGRPVIMYAEDPQYGAHSFVIDSVGSGTIPEYHILWGWGGEYDGYYDVDNLQVSDYHFSNTRRILTGVMPENGKQTEECPVEFSLRFSQSEVDGGANVTARVEIANRGYRDASGNYVAYLVSDDGVRTEIRKKKYFRDVPTNNMFTDVFTFNAPQQSGRYSVMLELRPFGSYSVLSPKVVGSASLTVKSSVADGINPIVGSMDASYGSADAGQCIYNISGQPANTDSRGVIIINGRKHIRSKW